MNLKCLIILSLMIIKITSFQTQVYDSHKIARFEAYLKKFDIKLQESEKAFRMYVFFKKIGQIEEFNYEHDDFAQGENKFTDLTDLEIEKFLGMGREGISDEYVYLMKHQSENPGVLEEFIQSDLEKSLLQLKSVKKLKQGRKLAKGARRNARQAARRAKREAKEARQPRKRAEREARRKKRQEEKRKRQEEKIKRQE